MPWTNLNQPTTLEKVIGGLCYLTFGLAGLLYIILGARRDQSEFFRFHFLQSILLGIIGLILGWTSSIFVTLVSSILMAMANFIPAISQELVAQVGAGLALGLGYIMNAGVLLLLYGMIFSFLGKYAEIPLISNIVRQQLR
jgi:uncharacterized membrane protein